MTTRISVLTDRFIAFRSTGRADRRVEMAPNAVITQLNQRTSDLELHLVGCDSSMTLRTHAVMAQERARAINVLIPGNFVVAFRRREDIGVFCTTPEKGH